MLCLKIFKKIQWPVQGPSWLTYLIVLSCPPSYSWDKCLIGPLFLEKSVACVTQDLEPMTLFTFGSSSPICLNSFVSRSPFFIAPSQISPFDNLYLISQPLLLHLMNIVIFFPITRMSNCMSSLMMLCSLRSVYMCLCVHTPTFTPLCIFKMYMQNAGYPMNIILKSSVWINTLIDKYDLASSKVILEIRNQ